MLLCLCVYLLSMCIHLLCLCIRYKLQLYWHMLRPPDPTNYTCTSSVGHLVKRKNEDTNLNRRKMKLLHSTRSSLHLDSFIHGFIWKKNDLAMVLANIKSICMLQHVFSSMYHVNAFAVIVTGVIGSAVNIWKSYYTLFESNGQLVHLSYF